MSSTPWPPNPAKMISLYMLVLLGSGHAFGRLHFAERVVRQHVVLEPAARLVRLLSPARRTRGHDLDEREAHLVDLILERLADGLLRLQDLFGFVDGDAREVRRRAKRLQQLDDAN